MELTDEIKIYKAHNGFIIKTDHNLKNSIFTARYDGRDTVFICETLDDIKDLLIAYFNLDQDNPLEQVDKLMGDD
jgi:hypothetical protein